MEITKRDWKSEKPWREPLEEGYWQSLLNEGESAAPVRPNELSEEKRNPAGETSDSGEVLELAATGFNRGGILVRFGGLQGFVPTSHVLGFPRRLSATEREERLAKRVGQKIKARVIDLD